MSKKRRQPPPRANVMIFVDASLCARTGAAGFGAWVKRDGGVSEVFGDRFKELMTTPNDAETCAIASALHRAVKWGVIHSGDVLMLQSDSLHALYIVRNLVGAVDNPAKGGRTVANARRRVPKPTPLQQRAVDHMKEIQAAYGLVFVVRHVKGHSGKDDGRSWVNRECDRTAKKHMRERRKDVAPATSDPQNEEAVA